MKKTIKSLLVIIAMTALLLCGLTINSEAAETKYFTMSDVSAKVGEKVTVEIKAKTDLKLEDMSLYVTYDSTKLSTTDESIKLSDSILNISGIFPITGLNAPGDARLAATTTADAFEIKAGSVIGTIEFTILDGATGKNDVTMKAEFYDTDAREETVVAKVTGIQPVTGITLDITAGTLNIGDTKTLTATVTPSNATSKEVIWESNNTSVATVANGKVTAVGKGTAVITAKAGDKTATYTVEVKAPLKSIKISQDSASILKNQSITLKINCNPEDTTDDTTVVWSSSDKEVATVENGVVKGLKAGKATITGRIGNFTATCEVTVKEIALNEIAINTQDFELEVDSTKKLNVIYNPENTTDDRTVEWKSSDEEVVTVDNGVVKGLKAGKATITATVNGKEATVEVTITEKVIVEENEEQPKEEEKEDVKEEVKDEEKQEEVKKEENSVLPQTGDIAIGLVVAVMIISGVAIVFIVRKNRK